MANVEQKIVRKLASQVETGRLARSSFLKQLAYMGVAASVGLAALSHTATASTPDQIADPAAIVAPEATEAVAVRFILIVDVA